MRNGNYDENLKEILLSTQHEGQEGIVYADGLIEKTNKLGHIILSGEEGEVNVSLYEKAKQLRKNCQENGYNEEKQLTSQEQRTFSAVDFMKTMQNSKGQDL